LSFTIEAKASGSHESIVATRDRPDAASSGWFSRCAWREVGENILDLAPRAARSRGNILDFRDTFHSHAAADAAGTPAQTERGGRGLGCPEARQRTDKGDRAEDARRRDPARSRCQDR
jgi:hypothetical protein